MTYEEFKKQFPQLIKSYSPSTESLARIQNVNLLIVVGPSGVGKSTLINKLDIPYVPSDTSRPPRTGEQNGIDMVFLNDYDQIILDIKQGKFVQAVVGVTGDFYATRASSYPASGWATMPVLADVVPFFRNLGFKETSTAFITPPNYDEWMRSMQTRQWPQDQIEKRLTEAKRSLNFALQDDQTHFILNDNLDSAAQQTKDLLDGRVNKDREQVARHAASEQLERISK